MFYALKCVCMPHSFSSSCPPLPALCPQVCSLRQCLCSPGAYVVPGSLYLFPGVGHGTPLQYSCLENPTDRGAWWAAVHGVAKNRTRLKRLSKQASKENQIHPILGGSDGKASAYNAGDLGLIPGSGRSSGEGNVNPLQYSCLRNPWTEESAGYGLWGHRE